MCSTKDEIESLIKFSHELSVYSKKSTDPIASDLLKRASSVLNNLLTEIDFDFSYDDLHG